MFTPEELREIHWAVTYTTDILMAKISSVKADMGYEPSPELVEKVLILRALNDKLMECRSNETPQEL